MERLALIYVLLLLPLVRQQSSSLVCIKSTDDKSGQVCAYQLNTEETIRAINNLNGELNSLRQKVEALQTNNSEHVSLLMQEIRNRNTTKLNYCAAGVSRVHGGGRVADNEMTASSIWDINFQPQDGRLDETADNAAWVQSGFTPGEWFQVDFLRPTILTGIVTQGRYDLQHGMQFPKTFKISYGNSTSQITMMSDGNGNDRVFQGNNNNRDYAMNLFPQPITARYVRFVTDTWERHPSVRLEYLVC